MKPRVQALSPSSYSEHSWLREPKENKEELPHTKLCQRKSINWLLIDNKTGKTKHAQGSFKSSQETAVDWDVMQGHITPLTQK